jgi:hypothetical protein
VLHNDAGNLAESLYGTRQTQPQYYRRIVTTIQQTAPFFEDFDLGSMRLDPNSILLNWRDRDSDYPFGPHQLSDGTLRTMALVALLAQPESELPSVMEIGLHPYALEIVAALVKSASVHCPVTTPDNPFEGMSFPDYRELRDKSRSFSGLAAYRLTSLAVASNPAAPAQIRFASLQAKLN